jgi:hypothetical protein
MPLTLDLNMYRRQFSEHNEKRDAIDDEASERRTS